MTKSDLIAKLNAIPGNPLIVVPAPDHSYRRVYRADGTKATYGGGELSEYCGYSSLMEGDITADVVVIS
jgi:hypothetical protein